MKLHHAWASITLAASAALSTGPALATAVLDQWGTLASVASFTCVTEGCDTSADLLSALFTTQVNASDGGSGQPLATAAVGAGWPVPGSASGTATVSGGLAVPILKAGAASTTMQWLGGQAMAVQAYTYAGPGETLSLAWQLTGSITNPDADHSTGLVMFAGFFDSATLGAFPDVSDPLSAAILLATLADASLNDEFREITADGAVDTSSSISLSVTPGQHFYLVMGLMAAAGGDGARAESLSTFAARFEGAPDLRPAFHGAMPLPATAALALLALALLPWRAARSTHRGVMESGSRAGPPARL